MYLVTVLGTSLILLLIRLDSRLNTPMYFFLSVLLVCGRLLYQQHGPPDARSLPVSPEVHSVLQLCAPAAYLLGNGQHRVLPAGGHGL